MCALTRHDANCLPYTAPSLQDKLRDYEKQIQELTTRLSNVEREKSTYELKCGEMEKVRHTRRPVICHCQVILWCHALQMQAILQNSFQPARPFMCHLTTLAISQVVRERMNNMSIHKVPQAFRMLPLPLPDLFPPVSWPNLLQRFAVNMHTRMRTLCRSSDPANCNQALAQELMSAVDSQEVSIFCSLWRLMMSWQRGKPWWRP